MVSRHALRWLAQVLAWGAIFIAVGALAVAVVVPRVAGATPYTVRTGSMQPAYPAGTLVVVKPLAFDEIGVGDVITYQLESGESTVVTHRVVSASTNLRGERLVRTQGDANDVVDAVPVREVQVKGKLWYSVPYLGYVNNWLSGKQRQTATVIVGAGLLAYAAYMFTSAARDRAVQRREKEEAAP